MADDLPGRTGVPGRTRRPPDLLTLLVGLASLGTACLAIVGYLPGIPGFDPRWPLAGAAVLVGVALLATSLRRSPQRDPQRDQQHPPDPGS